MAALPNVTVINVYCVYDTIWTYLFCISWEDIKKNTEPYNFTYFHLTLRNLNKKQGWTNESLQMKVTKLYLMNWPKTSGNEHLFYCFPNVTPTSFLKVFIEIYWQLQSREKVVSELFVCYICWLCNLFNYVFSQSYISLFFIIRVSSLGKLSFELADIMCVINEAIQIKKKCVSVHYKVFLK